MCLFFSYQSRMKQIQIHLIHGSTRKSFNSRKSNRLFGLLGGHVLIQIGEELFSFSYKERINRIWPRKIKKNGLFKIEYYPEWIQEVHWEKRTTYVVKLNQYQYENLQQIINNYKSDNPYDYALFGERCCSVHYRMLAGAEIIKSSPMIKWISTIPFFYIRLFRYFIQIPAVEVQKIKGCGTRIWF